MQFSVGSTCLSSFVPNVGVFGRLRPLLCHSVAQMRWVTLWTATYPFGPTGVMLGISGLELAMSAKDINAEVWEDAFLLFATVRLFMSIRKANRGG